MTGTYSIAEVVDDSNKRPGKTILSLRRFDDMGSESFSDGQWKSLKQVAKMVEGNGGKVFYSLTSASTYLNERGRK